MRYKMIVSYDGAYFHGFQRQKGYNSVQETLEQIFSHILKTEVVVKSAGRTDAGVHAYGQVIHFDSEQLIPPSNFKKISNKLLFPHIYIKDVKCVNTEFHSRVSAISKEYHYLVDIGEFCPLKSNYRHYFHNRIDIDKIKEAMSYIEGTHDFKSFSKNHVIKNTVRTIESFKLDVDGTLLTFKIVGTGFMYNMVRIIVALMLKVGEGKFEPTYIKKVLDGKDRALAPYVAPANGLYLYKVNYDKDYDI
ncbi:MAG: tRNA pseudouridine(38-40) synthase TruA [Bacilli bacterium]|nr:tRNA pseudouridine(38-40) synthase TruA [Bacilli bacterium]